MHVVVGRLQPDGGCSAEVGQLRTGREVDQRAVLPSPLGSEGAEEPTLFLFCVSFFFFFFGGHGPSLNNLAV